MDTNVLCALTSDMIVFRTSSQVDFYRLCVNFLGLFKSLRETPGRVKSITGVVFTVTSSQETLKSPRLPFQVVLVVANGPHHQRA